METAQVLANHPLFDGVEQDAMDRLLISAEDLHVSRGETIYTPQEFRRCLGVLRTGRVRVSKEALVVSILSAGDIFGAAAIFTDNTEYATTLTALAECEFILIPQRAVLRLLQESPPFAENYVRYLSGRIQFLSSRIDALAAGSAERKLAQYLLDSADEKDRLVTSATQLSARIGVGRATLYRVFDVLERQGAIARSGKEIHILNRAKLEPVPVVHTTKGSH